MNGGEAGGRGDKISPEVSNKAPGLRVTSGHRVDTLQMSNLVNSESGYYFILILQIGKLRLRGSK